MRLWGCGQMPFFVLLLVGCLRTASAGFFSSIVQGVTCLFDSQCEFCENKYIRQDIREALSQKLDDTLYGQPLVKQSVIPALRDHLLNDSPPKALVMSFHGWTGTGKNYVATMIADSIYERGIKSKFVHHFSVPYFFPDDGRDEIYKRQLNSWIYGNLTKCPRSLFIFDEMDRMRPGLIDAVKSFFKHQPVLNEAKSAVFIFISNSGSATINSKTLEFWETGRRREDLSLSDYENELNLAAYNEAGGLQGSQIIEKSLIDVFVPFLPLERSHVIRCIKDEWRKRIVRYGGPDSQALISDPTDDQIERVIGYLEFTAGIFLDNGCKRVYQKVNQVAALEEEIVNIRSYSESRRSEF